MLGRFRFCLLVTVFWLILAPSGLWAVRIKDMASVQGVRSNQLMGYGIMVGLDGTGDKTDQIQFIAQSVANMLERMGIHVPPDEIDQIRLKNVAAVMLTANLPPFAKVGSKVDVLVSSMGDAKSLQGGTLLLTPLRGADGKVYALAQGPVSVGGFAFGGAGGGGIQKNHPTVGRIPGGASIEREIPLDLNNKGQMAINLHKPDFTTALRVSRVINQAFDEAIAKPVDGSTIHLCIPDSYKENTTYFMASLECLDVVPDTVAKVVLNERTGTVVMGENVRISTVAIAHANLSVEIKEQKKVSPAQPFAPAPGPQAGGAVIAPGKGIITAPGGQTVVVPETEVRVEEEKRQLAVLPQGTNIGEVVRALNAIGVTPRDLISILQAMKAAGAIQAELEIM